MESPLNSKIIFSRAPTTRYRGSKRRILPWIFENTNPITRTTSPIKMIDMAWKFLRGLEWMSWRRSASKHHSKDYRRPSTRRCDTVYSLEANGCGRFSLSPPPKHVTAGSTEHCRWPARWNASTPTR